VYGSIPNVLQAGFPPAFIFVHAQAARAEDLCACGAVKGSSKRAVAAKQHLRLSLEARSEGVGRPQVLMQLSTVQVSTMQVSNGRTQHRTRVRRGSRLHHHGHLVHAVTLDVFDGDRPSVRGAGPIT
jgi:hypothetical protein